MKLITLVALLSFTSLLNAGEQFGSYKGTGFWKNNKGTSGYYEVKVQISQDKIESNYIDDFGRYHQRVLHIVREGDKLFLIRDGEKVGTAICKNNFSCQLQWQEPNTATITENLTWSKNKLKRSGTRLRDEGQQRVEWEEELERF